MAIIRLIRIERSIDVPALSKWVILVIVGDKSGLCLEDITSAIGSLSPHQHRCYLPHNHTQQPPPTYYHHASHPPQSSWSLYHLGQRCPLSHSCQPQSSL